MQLAFDRSLKSPFLDFLFWAAGLFCWCFSARLNDDFKLIISLDIDGARGGA
jgi:hypothetical protein